MESKYSESTRRLSSGVAGGAKSGAKLRKEGAKCKASAAIPREPIATSTNAVTANVNSREEAQQRPARIETEDEEEERLANAEWESLRRKRNQGEIRVSSNPAAQRILQGFRINHMRMRDAETGRLMWVSGDWGDDMFEKEKEAHVPASILSCRAVAREINFTSEEEMNKFRLEQRVYFQGVCMEEWFFRFGFVIPGSTNNWEQTIYAAEKSAMMPASLISGQITIETSFYDDDLFVSKSLVRVFYDGKEAT